MKYVSLLAALAVVLVPASAFATCPTQNGPYCVGGTCYDTYTFGTSCATTSGSVSAVTMWCYSSPAYQWNGSGTVDYVMTVPAGYGGTHWSAQIYAQFSDSTSNSLNSYSATVIVKHNGSVIKNTTFFQHNGSQGSLSCALEGTGYFSVSDGDTIQISMSGVNYSPYYTTMQMTTPTIFDN